MVLNKNPVRQTHFRLKPMNLGRRKSHSGYRMFSTICSKQNPGERPLSQLTRSGAPDPDFRGELNKQGHGSRVLGGVLGAAAAGRVGAVATVCSIQWQ